ncbi:NAD(P)-dependent oxidoreductase [Streptomyces camponoticapitis]|uniref:NAD(P)-dependent oxidoreductase n=2 Tax=Streptomyces camponoticapitis TaxID=1616125 RepID=A0ABQ2E180_9ACTN|nr:NAD(P)-dependent oxidoreductase [Streptomyces camponoticapitis]
MGSHLMSIVVTGSTGHLGRLVIESLLTAGVPAGGIAAVARDSGKAASLAALGVEVRIADYDTPATLTDAFRAGDRVLFISGNEAGRRVPQHAAVIDAARAAGVAQLAYTGVLRGPEADFELAADHKATERLILDSGLPHTFLRNGWYTENYTENLAPVLEHGAVVAAAGEGRVASAARADYAAAAAAVLTGEGHLGKTYELSGDTAWSFAEYAAELSRQTGRTIVYSNVPGETLLEILTGAGVPEPMAAILLGVDKAIERGLLAGTPGDLSRLSGRPTTPLAQSVAEALKS